MSSNIKRHYHLNKHHLTRALLFFTSADKGLFTVKLYLQAVELKVMFYNNIWAVKTSKSKQSRPTPTRLHRHHKNRASCCSKPTILTDPSDQQMAQWSTQERVKALRHGLVPKSDLLRRKHSDRNCNRAEVKSHEAISFNPGVNS